MPGWRKLQRGGRASEFVGDALLWCIQMAPAAQGWVVLELIGKVVTLCSCSVLRTVGWLPCCERVILLYSPVKACTASATEVTARHAVVLGWGRQRNVR
jgi:hypothetical protein